VPDAAGDGPMLIGTGELRGIGARLEVWHAVGIPFQGDRGHGDDRRHIIRFSKAYPDQLNPGVDELLTTLQTLLPESLGD
jgi:hypothetical protein